MSVEGWEYASLSHNAVDKLKDLENSLSTLQNETNPGDEVVVIAFKRNK